MRTPATRRRPEPARISFLGSFLAAFFLFGLFGLLGGAGTAFAYSLSSGPRPGTVLPPGFFDPSGNPSGGNDLLLPFENFVKSMGSIGSIQGPALNPTVANMPGSSVIMQGLQGIFSAFDLWLYGLIGFHIGGLLFAVLNILSWLLGAVKGTVDWLLGLFH